MTDDNLPKRWKANRPPIVLTLRQIVIGGCAVLVGLAAVREADLPDQAVGKVVSFFGGLSTATSIAPSGVAIYTPFHNETTGEPIVTVTPMMGRAATVRQHVEDHAKPPTVIAFFNPVCRS